MPDTPDRASHSDRWWLPIAALAATLPVLLALGFLAPPDAVAAIPAFAVALAGAVLALLSPVFVHFDRQYLAAEHDWTPAAVHYLMVVPAIAPLVAAVYLYRRHRAVGVPANPLAASE